MGSDGNGQGRHLGLFSDRKASVAQQRKILCSGQTLAWGQGHWLLCFSGFHLGSLSFLRQFLPVRFPCTQPAAQGLQTAVEATLLPCKPPLPKREGLFFAGKVINHQHQPFSVQDTSSWTVTWPVPRKTFNMGYSMSQ